MAIHQNIVLLVAFIASVVLLMGTYHSTSNIIFPYIGSSVGKPRYIFVDLGANRGDSLEVFLGNKSAKFKYDFPRPEWATPAEAGEYTH